MNSLGRGARASTEEDRTPGEKDAGLSSMKVHGTSSTIQMTLAAGTLEATSRRNNIKTGEVVFKGNEKWG